MKIDPVGKRLLVVSLVILASMALCVQVSAAGSQTGTGNRTITVVMDNNYPPYTFLDSNGRPQGVLIDLWHLWEVKTGNQAVIYPMDWNEALLSMDTGEFDVIDTIFYSEARAKKYDFGKPYATLDVPLFFKNDISGISGPDSVKGFVVAVKSGDYAAEYLKQQGVRDLQEYPSYEAIVTAAKNGDVVVFCIDKPPALYYLYKNGIQGMFHQTGPLYSGEFHRAVKKGDTETLNLVEDGFLKISQGEFREIERKWYGTSLVSPEALRSVIVTFLVATAFITLMFIWNRTLKKNVQEKTIELKKEVEISTSREEALRKSEEQLRLLIQNSPVAMMITSGSHHDILWVNKKFTALYGYNIEDIPDFERWRSLAYPDLYYREQISREWTERIGKALANEENMEPLMVRITSKGGNERVVEVSATSIGNNVLVLFNDLTERILAEKALKEREEQYRALVEASPDLLWEIDLEGKIRYISPQVTAILGYNPGDIEGMSIFSLVPKELVADTREIFSQYRESCISLHPINATAIPLFTMESPVVRKDGEPRTVEIRSTPVFDSTNTLVGLRGIGRDITERKKAEESIRVAREYAENLINTANTMIIGLNESGDITLFNDEAENVTGYTREEMLGRNWFDTIVPKDYLPDIRHSYQRFISNGGLRHREYPILTRSGQERFVIWKNNPVYENGQITGTILFGIDITERKDVEEALKQARKKLNLLNFVTFQEIQNSVFSLAAFLDLMETTPGCTDAGTGYISKEKALISKITNLLNFAKDYQDLGVYPPRWQIVGHIFLLAISHLDFLSIQRNVHLDNLEIYADSLLEKAFFNMMENVLVHGVRVTEVNLSYYETTGGLVLVIEDNGVGVAPKYKKDLFDRGFGKNTGLGLFLVREILSLTGISIQETGEEGKGARFEISIPKGAFRFKV